MKKRLGLLALFNLGIIGISIFFFSKQSWGLGLGFSPSLGAFKFAASIAVAVELGLFFFYVNYMFLTYQDKSTDIQNKDLTSIDKCMQQLKQARKSNPAFNEEIDTAIKNLQTLQRREETLNKLLETNNLTNLTALKETAQSGNRLIFTRINIIINNLLVFDNVEYNDSNDEEMIRPFKEEIDKALADIQKTLWEYNQMLMSINNYIKQSLTIDVSEIIAMTEAFNSTWEGYDK